jgi:hypothetical protein
MSQSGILNRGVYPPGTVVETLQGSNVGTLFAPPVSPDATNNIILNSTNGNLTFSNGAGNILNLTVNPSPVITYVDVGAPYPRIYNASVATEYISCDTNGGTITINLPSAGVAVGETWIIKDRTGQANYTNPPEAFNGQITIQSLVGGKTIDGSANYIINASFGSVRILYNGTNYEVF